MSSFCARRVAGTAALVAALMATGCGGGERQVERAVLRRFFVKEGSTAEYRAVARRDFWRDLVTRAEELRASRTVYRYVSAEEARLIRQQGFGAATHFTAGVTPGRPLSAAAAAERYGLGRAPAYRVAVEVPAGTRVKFNKALGGEPGWGELLVMSKVPPTWIKGMAPIR